MSIPRKHRAVILRDLRRTVRELKAALEARDGELRWLRQKCADLTEKLADLQTDVQERNKSPLP